MAEKNLFVKKDKIEDNPKKLIIFARPKTGKTTIVAGLENALILEFEKDGADYIKGYVEQINNLTDLRNAGQKLKESGYPFKYGVIDTVTALEDMCITLAGDIYKSTPYTRRAYYK